MPINVKTANALGLTIPVGVFEIADEVVQRRRNWQNLWSGWISQERTVWDILLGELSNRETLGYELKSFYFFFFACAASANLSHSTATFSHAALSRSRCCE